MISDHSEIEAKMAAEGVSVDKFVEFMFKNGLKVEKFIRVLGPDHYYENASGNVLRHRIDLHGGRSELTVKRRKSDGSTRDREEIDLFFDPVKTSAVDVSALLKAVGFSNVLVLTKEAHIFWVSLTPNVNATFVIYDVWQGNTKDDVPGTTKRFLEVEIEKGSNITSDTAKRHIKTWVEKLRQELKVGEPLNDSLWEIYSGKKYKTVT